MTKKCSKCQEVKPLVDFWQQKSKPDGKTCWCKPCMTEYVRNWRRNIRVKKEYNQNLFKAFIAGKRL